MSQNSLRAMVTEECADLLSHAPEGAALYDRRTMPRWTTSNAAFYRRKNDNVLFRTQLKDVTISGACLYVNYDIHVNDCLDIRIALSKSESVQAQGRVLWKQVNTEHIQAGVIFDHVSQGTQDSILSYSFKADSVCS